MVIEITFTGIILCKLGEGNQSSHQEVPETWFSIKVLLFQRLVFKFFSSSPPAPL